MFKRKSNDKSAAPMEVVGYYGPYTHAVWTPTFGGPIRGTAIDKNGDRIQVLYEETIKDGEVIGRWRDPRPAPTNREVILLGIVVVILVLFAIKS